MIVLIGLVILILTIVVFVVISSTTKEQYSCKTAGLCIKDPNGTYASKAECEAVCKAPQVVRYDCDATGKCVVTANGKYTTSDCDSACKAPIVVKYDCDTTGKCLENLYGKYTTSNCDSACKAPQVVKYDCDTTGKCVVTANGKYTTSDCDSACKAPAPTFQYDCNDKGACVPTKGGRWLVPDCNNSCTIAYSCDTTNYTCKPDKNGAYGSLSTCQTACVVPKVMWKCTDPINKLCIQGSDGKYSTQSDCTANCPYVPPPPQYDCDASGKCIQTVGGKYTTSNCDNACIPPVIKYACTTKGQVCVPDPNGTYTETTRSTCDLSCKTVTGGYSCVSGKCVTDPKSTTSLAQCSVLCGAPPPHPTFKTYECGPDNLCISSPNGSYTSYSDCVDKCVAPPPAPPIEPITPSTVRWKCNTATKQCEVASTGTFSNLNDCVEPCLYSDIVHYSCDQSVGYCVVDPNGLYTDPDTCYNSCAMSNSAKTGKYLMDGDTFVLSNKHITDFAKKWQYVSKYSNDIYDQLALGDVPIVMRIHKVTTTAPVPTTDKFIRNGDVVQIEVIGNGYLWLSTTDVSRDKICGKDTQVLKYSQPSTNGWTNFIINYGMPRDKLIVKGTTINNVVNDSVVYRDETPFNLYSSVLNTNKYMQYDYCTAVGVVFYASQAPPSSNAAGVWIARNWKS